MTNPLITPVFAIPFDKIAANDVEPAITELLRLARERIASICAISDPATFENTMLALEDATRALGFAQRAINHIEAVATTPEFRAAYNSVQGPISEFQTEMVLNSALWNRLKAVPNDPGFAQLEAIERRLVTETIADFRRNGADLDAVGRERLKQINVQLTETCNKFSQNVLDATNAFELLLPDQSRLAGMPESALQAAHADAEGRNQSGYRISLQAPSYIAVMTYADDRTLREEIYRAFQTRGASAPTDNRDLVAQILQLRRDQAELLGFRSFADLVADDRMVKVGDRAVQFIDDLAIKLRPHAAREQQELAEFARTRLGIGDLNAWDLAYVAEKMRKASYDFDDEILRPYFPMTRVMQGMFVVANRLFGVTVERTTDLAIWEPTVEAYAVRDRDGTHLGSFYADYVPRDSKRGGAWMEGLVYGTTNTGGEWSPHLGFMGGNFSKPLGDKPALLTHDEVLTLFHEFGHLLHHLLGRVALQSMAGTNVALDFVELPSQIMENWCWEPEALALFARHVDTNEAIPFELVEKLRRARNFRAASDGMRQLGFATVDLRLHTIYDPQRDGDVVEYARKIVEQFSPLPLPEYHAMIAAFTHLFGDAEGYAAGYYSYKWSEALDADAFTKFQKSKAGIFDPEVGREFREKILARGNSEEPLVLFKQFMGREPDAGALLRREGLE